MLAGGKLGEAAVAEVPEREEPHPELNEGFLLFVQNAEKPNRVEEAGGDDVVGGGAGVEIEVQLGRDETDAFFNIPDGFAGAPPAVEQPA